MKISANRISLRERPALLKGSLLAGTLMIAATLPAYADGRFDGFQGGGFNQFQNSFKQSFDNFKSNPGFSKDVRPNIPVNIPTIPNNPVVSIPVMPVIQITVPNIPHTPAVSIDIPNVSNPRASMPVNLPVTMPVSMPVNMPTIVRDTPSISINMNSDAISRMVSPKNPVSIDIGQKSFTPPTISIDRVASHTPIVLSPPPIPSDNGRNIDSTPPVVIDAKSVDPDNGGRGGGGNGRAGQIQIQAVQIDPSAGQVAPQQPGASPSAVNNGLGEVNAPLFVGRAQGSVVTADYVPGVIDADTIKDAVSEKIALFEGTTLFVPHNDMIVETAHGNVHIASNSVVLVSSNLNDLAVYDIHDHKKGSIWIETTGKRLNLAPGRHIVITTDESGNFAMANAIQTIPHCDITRMPGEEAKTIFISEFSIPAAINAVGSLKALATSDDPDLQKVSGRVMKTAAILLHMRGSQYKHYFKPKVTLLSQQ